MYLIKCGLPRKKCSIKMPLDFKDRGDLKRPMDVISRVKAGMDQVAYIRESEELTVPYKKL